MSAEEEIKKRCSKCKEEKPLVEFYKATKGTYGVEGYCKKCRKIVNKRWDRKNRIVRRKMGLRYKRNNLEKVRKKDREAHRLYRENHKEVLNAACRRYREKNKDAINKRRRQLYKEKKEGK